MIPPGVCQLHKPRIAPTWITLDDLRLATYNDLNREENGKLVNAEGKGIYLVYQKDKVCTIYYTRIEATRKHAEWLQSLLGTHLYVYRGASKKKISNKQNSKTLKR